MSACCGPSADDRSADDPSADDRSADDRSADGRAGNIRTPRPPVTAPAELSPHEPTSWHTETVPLPGGTIAMGTDSPGYHADGEGPVHPVRLSPFRLATHLVSNDDFARFIDATGYVSEAEHFGSSFVFGGLLSDDHDETRGVAAAPWWREVIGATWRHPEGPASDVRERLDHPVIHVSWNDASAFCRWAGGRLPTEAEWEYAARGGLEGSSFPWGDELEPGGEHRMNVFQGEFPNNNTVVDGWAGTSPTGHYLPNGHGLFDMTGNVWEWCNDWFDPDWYRHSPIDDPRGPETGQAKVMRGGSYLCHESYCRRYRVDARSSNTPDSSTGNIGFRIAF